jgi:hypothetical protein
MAISLAGSTGRGRSALAEAIGRPLLIWRQPAGASRDVCALLLILALSGSASYIGAAHTRIFGHDIFILYDFGWRVLNGQRPSVDFYASGQALLALLCAAGLKLAHNSANGIGYASALVGAVTGVWGYALCRRRMAWVPATLAALILVGVAAAPYPLGWTPNTLSHAMVYNRYGFAFLGLVMLEAFKTGVPFQKGVSGRFSRFGGGLSSGIAIVAMTFIKPSYGLVGLAFVGWSLVLERHDEERLAGILLGMIVVGLGMMAWLRFDFVAVWNDFQMTAVAKQAGVSTWGVRWAILKGLSEFLPILVLALLVAALKCRRETLLASLQPVALALLVLIGGALLLATNAQPSGFPLNALLAVILIEQGRAADSTSPSTDFPHAGAFPQPDGILLLLGLAVLAPTLVANAAGLGYGAWDARKNPSASEVLRFAPPHLASLLLYDIPGGTDADYRSNGRVYVTYVNDGVELIQKVSRPAETVFTLDMVNPFPYALLRPPARGGAPDLAFQHTFSDTHKPDPDWLFGHADVVMFPKRPSGDAEQAGAMSRNYEASLQARFRLCAESDWWKLYKRPSNLKGCPAQN